MTSDILKIDYYLVEAEKVLDDLNHWYTWQLSPVFAVGEQGPVSLEVMRFNYHRRGGTTTTCYYLKSSEMNLKVINSAKDLAQQVYTLFKRIETGQNKKFSLAIAKLR